MPEIGVFTHKQGTAPTIAYLTDLIRRRIRPGGVERSAPEEAALAFLYLVVGGPASMTAWGIALDKAEIDKHTRYCVRLFLHGLLHSSPESATRTNRGVRRGARQRSATSCRKPMQLRTTPTGCRTLEEENRRLKVTPGGVHARNRRSSRDPSRHRR